MPEISGGGSPFETPKEQSFAKEQSFGSVLKEVGTSMKDLVQSEIGLARAELKETSRNASKHLAQAISFGMLAALSVLPMLAFLVIGIGLMMGGRYWLSSLIVALVCLAVGAPLAMRAFRKLKDEDAHLDRALGGIERGRDAIQQGVRDVKDAAQQRRAG